MSTLFAFDGVDQASITSSFTSRNGTFKTVGNKAVAKTYGTSPVSVLATYEYVPDCDITVTINGAGEVGAAAVTGYSLRWIDNNNFIQVSIDNDAGEVIFLRRTSGTFTPIATAYTIPAFSNVANYDLRVVMLGTSIEVYLGATLIETLTEAQGETSPHHGMFTYSASATYDNMVFEGVNETRFTFDGANNAAIPIDFTTRTGSFKLSSNKAISATLGTYPIAIATYEYAANCTASAVVNGEGASSGTNVTGLCLRWIDNDNFLDVSINNANGELLMLRRTAGAFVAMTQQGGGDTSYTIPAYSSSTDYTIDVIMLANIIEVYIDNVLVQTIDESQGQASPHHGLLTFSAISSIDTLIFSGASITPADSITTDLVSFQGFHASIGSTKSLTVAGNYVYTAGSATISYKLNGGAAVVGDASPAATTFSFVIPSLPVGQHTIEVYITQDAAVTQTFTNITIAPAFHGIGQSLMESVGTNNQTLVPNGSTTAILLGFDDVWKEFVDPWSDHTNNVDPVTNNAVPVGGSWMMHFANSYLAAKNSPAIFVPNARGSMSSDKWLKTSTFTDGGALNLYQALARRIALTGGVEYVLWEGNESDIIESRSVTATKANMNQIINDIFTDFGVKTWIVPMHTYKSGVYDGDGVTYGQIPHRAMQVELAAENANCEIVQPLSDLDVLVGAADDTGDNDGVHFFTDGVLTTVGQRVYESMFAITNTAPVANAGVDQANIVAGATVTLDGTGSNDADSDPLTYLWTPPAGITLSSNTAAQPTFTAPTSNADQTLTFSLVVNDGTEDSIPDTVDKIVLAEITSPPTTVDIPTATLAEISDSTSSVNQVGGSNGRPEASKAWTVRITDHADDDGAEAGADTDKMAIFSSKAHGHPWVKEHGLKHRVSDGDAALTDATVIFPDFDYSTFE